jgi:hypothetical protein
MVLALLKTAVGIVVLAFVFSSPFIGAYVLYELVWPRVAPYVRGGRISTLGRNE